MIRVMLPAHLRALAHISSELRLDLNGRASVSSVLDAIEREYPMLRGAIRDHTTHKRRPFIRFFACARDLSHESTETPLPAAVIAGDEPLLIVGAIAGG